MADLRPVLLIIGALVTLLGLFMVAPLLVDLAHDNDSWRGFAISMVITLFIGILLLVGTRGGPVRLSTRGAFFLTTFSWLVLCLFAALPFLLNEAPLTLTNAIFESMSGLTTTGSTVMTGLDEADHGILLWRAILQWIGGIGIIVTALAVLPMLKVGGMQLFGAEWFEPMGKILPRAQSFAIGIGVAYVGLTALCAFVYWSLGIETFDAICLAMTTLSTGGFANSDISFAAFSHGGADIAASIFMVLAALPFAAYILAVRGDLGALFKNVQIRGFLILLLILIAIMTFYIISVAHVGAAHPIRLATFNVVSIITGTGFGFGDFQQWGPMAAPFFFILMFVGGCAGSTTCAIKIFRFQVAYEGLRSYVRRMIYPHEVDTMIYNGRILPDSALYSVLGFIFVFFACYAVLAIGLSLTGLDMVTSISSAATAISNVGPGLGSVVGPSGNFSSLPDPAKWMLVVGMIVGRLEIFTVLVLFTPRFWMS